MLGPLFRYELTRLARRGLQPALRAAFAALLLVVLFLSYLAAFPQAHPLGLITAVDEPLTTERASRFGERFVHVFLYVQAAVVVLVTPAVAAGAIGEEKDRGSLDMLLTTTLSSWEIVAAKFAARLAFLAALLLTGLPVVALVVVFGGVDPEQLLAGYAVSLTTACSLGAFTLFVSLVTESAGAAILRAYVWGVGLTAFGFCFACFKFPACFSPVGATLVVLEGWPAGMGPPTPAALGSFVGVYAAAHLSVAALFVRLAVRSLRRVDPGGAATRRANALADPVEVRAVAVPPPLWAAPPVDDGDPLGWKERHFGGKNPLGLSPELFVLASLALPLIFYGFVGSLVVGEREPLAALVALAGGLAVLVAGARATAAVVGERHRGTLDSLLALPIDRWELLAAKCLSAFRGAVPFATVAAVVLALGVLRGAVLLPGVVGVPLVLGGWLAAAVGYGLWLSVRCATRERAFGWFLGVGLVCGVLPPLVADVAAGFAGECIDGLSPATGLWAAVPGTREWVHYRRMPGFGGAAVGAALAAACGLLLGLLAARRFGRRE